MILILFSLSLLDAFIQYFLGQLSARFPVNILVAICFLFVVFKHGLKILDFRFSVVVLIFMLALGFLLPIISLDVAFIQRFSNVVSILVAFFVGYVLFRWSDNIEYAVKCIAIIGMAYAVACLIALYNVYPALFPVKLAFWSQQGVVQARPEVMVDQNFQIFYLFICVLPIFVMSSKIKLLFSIVSVFLSALVLAKLQTRSGIGILSIGLVFSLTYAWYRGNLNFYYILSIFGLFVPLVLYIYIDSILKAIDLLLYRITSEGYATAYGRIYGFEYLFEKLLDPFWWWPQGNSEFLRITGDLPHSNGTAVFLEGGMLSLFSWIFLVLVPIYKAFPFILRKKSDDNLTIAFAGAFFSLLIQLTLNVPLYDHVWLWAGSLVGSYKRFLLKITRRNIV